MLRWGYDETRGQIIGGYSVSGQLYYDGRPQGGIINADTEKDLMAQAKIEIQAFKNEFCGHPCYLYEDDTKWEIKY